MREPTIVYRVAHAPRGYSLGSVHREYHVGDVITPEDIDALGTETLRGLVRLGLVIEACEELAT